MRGGAAAPAIVTGEVSRGTILTEIAATGTLEAVTTVQVGSQVSGSIQELNADFNSIVRKGQVLARLDPSLFQTQVDSARANLTSAQADLQRAQVMQADAQVKVGRARELADRQLIPATDLEAAEVAQRSADAQVRSAQAQLTQARAGLTQAEVNLQKTIITSPIDGIVIGRSVDVGQTVAASLSAPTIFTLAADLSQMQVKTNIDESDLGNVKDGQAVTFRVDAYPTRTFTGTVTQIRLDPVVVQQRRDLRGNHLGGQPGARAEAGHDGQRHHRSGAQGQCVAGAGRGAALPSDRVNPGGARSGRQGAGEPQCGRARCGGCERQTVTEPYGCLMVSCTR